MAIDFVALLPLIVLAAGATIVMLAAAFFRNHMVALLLTLVTLAAAFISLLPIVTSESRAATSLLAMDDFSLFFMALIFVATFAIAILAHGYFSRRPDAPEEFYILLLLATTGSAAMVAANHFATFILGLEILSVSLYAMVAYQKSVQASVEAGLKYLVLAGASSAFLLFGMALVYSQTGTMDFGRLGQSLATAAAHSPVMMMGLGMMIVGIGFKLAVVPFHLWTPDVYQGAPAPVTAFVATVSKGAMFALLVRFFNVVDIRAYPSLVLAFGLIAVLSMLGGNLLALRQNNIKRVLAYSSIAHLGYLLVAFLASGPLAIMAVTFYLTTYFVTTLGSFGVVTALSGPERDAELLEDYRGLAFRRPWMTALFTGALMSLAGLPLTAGFVGKFFLITAGIGFALWILALVLVVGSAISIYYYLRIVFAMFQPAAEGAAEAPASLSMSPAGGVVLAAIGILILGLGVYPTPLVQLIQTMITGII